MQKADDARQSTEAEVVAEIAVLAAAVVHSRISSIQLIDEPAGVEWLTMPYGIWHMIP